MTRSHRATAAVLVTAAAAALLGGCGGGHDNGARATPGPASAPASVSAGVPDPPAVPDASGSARSPAAETPTGRPASPGPAAEDAPKVPDARITKPGGGTFTKPQKSYLSGRVPEGTDPVAVLEGGQELCERLARTSQIDPDAAASAILTGDISRAGAEAAVRSLCPDQRPVLDAADRGFPDGGFSVAAEPVPGTSVAPGAYHAPNPSPMCTWRVFDAKGATLSSGSGGSAADAHLTITPAADGVTSSGCYAWLASGGTR